MGNQWNGIENLKRMSVCLGLVCDYLCFVYAPVSF